MIEKLFDIRLQLHYTNSKSYIAGCEDVFVVGTDAEDAFKRAKANFVTRPNTVVAHSVFIKEITNFIPDKGAALQRNVLIEKNI